MRIRKNEEGYYEYHVAIGLVIAVIGFMIHSYELIGFGLGLILGSIVEIRGDDSV